MIPSMVFSVNDETIQIESSSVVTKGYGFENRINYKQHEKIMKMFYVTIMVAYMACVCQHSKNRSPKKG
jgi:hypothetical protein